MFENSMALHVFLAVKQFVLSFYDSSVTKRVIMRFVAFLKRYFESSIVYRIFMCKSPADNMRRKSMIYRAVSASVNSIVSVFSHMYVYIKKNNTFGINRYIFDTLSEKKYFAYEYFCAALIAVMLIVPHNYWNNLYAVLFAFALLGLYFLRAVSKSGKVGINVYAVPASLVSFLIIMVSSAVMSPDRVDSLRIALFFFSSVIFMLVICGGTGSALKLKNMVSIILAALLIMSLYAIWQNHVGVDVVAELTDLNANEGMPGRVYSTFENPNNFAEAIVLLIPFNYALFIISENKISKLVYAGIFAVSAVALLMTYSRSCYVSFAIATVIFLILYDWKYIIPLAVVGITAIPFLPESVLNRILTIGSMNDTSNFYRIYLWGGIIKMISVYWVTGVGLGPGAFAAVYPRFAHHFATTAPHSHMLYLELIVELGIIGAVSFFVFIFFVFKKGLSTFNKTSKELRCLIIAAVSGLCGIAFSCAAEYIWFYPRVMFVYWIVIGILLCAVRLSEIGKKA